MESLDRRIWGKGNIRLQEGRIWGEGNFRFQEEEVQVKCGGWEEEINIKTEEEVQVKCGGWEEAKTSKEERRRSASSVWRMGGKTK